MCENLVSSV